MAVEHVVRFMLEDGSKPSLVNVQLFGHGGNGIQAVTGDLHVVGTTTVVASPAELGYWVVIREVTQDLAIGFPRIVPPGRFGWWHHLHGVAAGHSPGRGIRIGVVDEALEIQGEASCIHHVNNLADAAWSAGSPQRAVHPFVSHSHSVCSLLASRPLDNQGVAGVAPGADVYFAAAGEDESPRLNPTRVANAIDMLAEEYDCHLITVSAGDCEKPTEEILFSVQAAREHGCLCLFAAGNQGGQPLYPARYAECLAVGAVGLRGTAPEGTYVYRVAQEAEIEGDEGLFLWRSSAYGERVEILAAGVGVLWCINGRIASAAWGTSYASPVAAGVLAVILAENEEYLQCQPGRERGELALHILRASCRSLGFAGVAAYGIPVAQGEGRC